MKFTIKTPICLYFENPYPEALVITTAKGYGYFYRKTNEVDVIKVNIPHPDHYISNIPYFDESKIIDFTDTAKKIILPEPERERMVNDFYHNFKDDIGHTPARIYAKKGAIQLNKKNFYEIPCQSQIFIYFHELGHIYYKTEWKCDLFAYKLFLLENLNPSQAVLALTRFLRSDEESLERIKSIYNLAIQ
jgi:hypothetical protein